MSWLYEQKTGQLFHDGEFIGVGYSGLERGKNNPELQAVHDIGPIPQGKYKIGEPSNSDRHGPFVLPLTPDPMDIVFGRSGFLIHGDSKSHPGKASEGCIVLDRLIRNKIAQSNDHDLEVVRW